MGKRVGLGPTGHRAAVGPAPSYAPCCQCLLLRGADRQNAVGDTPSRRVPPASLRSIPFRSGRRPTYPANLIHETGRLTNWPRCVAERDMVPGCVLDLPWDTDVMVKNDCWIRTRKWDVMRVRIACLNQTTWLVLGVLCMLGIGGPVRAAPISGPIVEETPGNSVTTGKWPEAPGSPAPYSGDVADVQDNAPVAKPGQEQFGRDGLPPPLPSSRSRPPLIPSPGQTQAPTGSPQGAIDQDWTLDHEVKEAVRPLYEDLKASGVAEAVRSLTSDLGLSGSSSLNDPTPSESAKDSGNGAPTESAVAERLGNNYAPQDRPRSATQTEQDKLAAAALWREFIEELKPWLFGLAGLFVLGYMAKLGLDFFLWAAARSTKRSSRGKRRRRHHRRPPGTTDKSGALSPGSHRTGRSSP